MCTRVIRVKGILEYRPVYQRHFAKWQLKKAEKISKTVWLHDKQKQLLAILGAGLILDHL